MRELPVGWEITPIENVLEPKYEGKTIQQGWSPRCEKHPSSCNNTWGVLKTTAIQAGYFIENENKELPEHLTPKEQIEVSEGDILLTCAGPRNRCGVPTLVRKTRPKLMMSGKMYRFRAFEEYFQPSFLELYLLSHEAQLAIDKMKTGSSDSGLNLTHGRFRELLIPVAPFKEQQRIVDKVEELFSELDKGIESLKTAKAQLAVYRQALLKHAFEGKLTEQWRASNADKLESPEQLLTRIQQEREARYQQQLDDWKQEVEEWETDGKEGKKPAKPKQPKEINLTDIETDSFPEGWCGVRAEVISDFVTKGTTPKKEDLYSGSGEIPFLKVYNLTKTGKLDFTIDPTYVTEETHKNFLARSQVFPGDVLMNIVGPPLGKVSIVPSDFPQWNINQAIVRYRTNILESHFLANYLLSENVVRSMMRKAKATAGQFNLTLEICRDVILPVCSESEQSEIVNILSGLLSVVDSSDREIEANLKRSEVLKQSILKKAFSGQLVPQNSDDEPASELLKKIAIEKAELAEKEKAEKAAARKSKSKAKAATKKAKI